MSERIRQLEEALRSLHLKLSPDEHPLLSQELLLIKKSPELFGVEQQQQLAAASAEARTGREETVASTARAESAGSSTREPDVRNDPEPFHITRISSSSLSSHLVQPAEMKTSSPKTSLTSAARFRRRGRYRKNSILGCDNGYEICFRLQRMLSICVNKPEPMLSGSTSISSP